LYNEIGILANDEKLIGNYEVKFSAIGGSAYGGDATTLPSGIYFCRILAGSFNQKKMILLKLNLAVEKPPL